MKQKTIRITDKDITYIFQKPDFKCTLLAVNGMYIVGYIEDSVKFGEIATAMWEAKTGKSVDGTYNDIDINLIPTEPEVKPVPKQLHLTRKPIHKQINKYIYGRNRTHYLKWELKNHWSVRYFFTFDARPEYNGQWVLKNHKSKRYIVLIKHEALDYIQGFCHQIEPKEYFSVTEFGKGYRRLTIDPKRGSSCFIETNQQKKEGC